MGVEEIYRCRIVLSKADARHSLIVLVEPPRSIRAPRKTN